jgi:hypothetical protein
MQCACAILSSVASPAVPYIATLFHKRQDFRKKKKKLLYTKCVLISSINLSETFLIPRRTERDIIKNVYWSTCKVTVIVVRC